MPDLTDTEIRAVALEAASRVVTPGSPSGYITSSARQFEGYIRTGLTQVGPRFRQGITLGRTGALLRVEGDLTAEVADDVAAAVTAVLEGAQ